jgi:hypothetical protein
MDFNHKRAIKAFEALILKIISFLREVVEGNAADGAGPEYEAGLRVLVATISAPQ